MTRPGLDLVPVLVLVYGVVLVAALVWRSATWPGRRVGASEVVATTLVFMLFAATPFVAYEAWRMHGEITADRQRRAAVAAADAAVARLEAERIESERRRAEAEERALLAEMQEVTLTFLRDTLGGTVLPCQYERRSCMRVAGDVHSVSQAFDASLVPGVGEWIRPWRVFDARALGPVAPTVGMTRAFTSPSMGVVNLLLEPAGVGVVEVSYSGTTWRGR